MNSTSKLYGTLDDNETEDMKEVEEYKNTDQEEKEEFDMFISIKKEEVFEQSLNSNKFGCLVEELENLVNHEYASFLGTIIWEYSEHLCIQCYNDVGEDYVECKCSIVSCRRCCKSHEYFTGCIFCDELICEKCLGYSPNMCITCKFVHKKVFYRYWDYGHNHHRVQAIHEAFIGID